MPLDSDGLADLVLQTIEGAQAPLVMRLALLEAEIGRLRELPDRLAALDRWALEAAAALGERLAGIEARPAVPGPPGPAGADGKDGRHGLDGAAGQPGLRFAGVYAEGTTYTLGDLVTWAGSFWHCNEATATRPGDGSAAWTLAVKRGRDGKDLRP